MAAKPKLLGRPNAPDSTSPRPLLRWAGSKKRLLSRLKEAAPNKFKKYIEPFAGSACLFLSLNPKKAVLGDMNSELIQTYRAVRQRPTHVWQITKSIARTKREYYRIRSQNPQSLNRYYRAARFIYLNRLCFNGLYRTNKSGQFNVPKGKKTGELPELKVFLDFAKMLRKARLVRADFEMTLAYAEKGDFVYLDPPYASITVKDRNEYGVGSFKPADIPRLISSLEKLHKKGVRFLLSYSTAPDFIAQIKNPSKPFSIQRTIASRARFRKLASETLLNNEDLFPND